MFYANTVLPDGWAFRARAAYAELIQESATTFYLRESRIARPAVVSTAYAEIQRLNSSRHPRDRFVRMTIPNITKAFTVSMRVQVQIDHARIAIAIERYRLRKRALPDSLGELVPEYLDRLPNDLIGGEPYQYRPLTEDEFMLWSVGWNEIDEHGAIAKTDEEGDWVWFSFAKD